MARADLLQALRVEGNRIAPVREVDRRLADAVERLLQPLDERFQLAVDLRQLSKPADHLRESVRDRLLALVEMLHRQAESGDQRLRPFEQADLLFQLSVLAGFRVESVDLA